MVRPLVTLFVSAAVLAHGFAWPAVTTAPGSHACCVRVMAVTQQCRTTISCCPASERRQPGTVPPGSTTQGTSSPLLTLTTLDAAAVSLVSTASAAALDAHALLRANAPPPLLYLKHLTLLV